MWTHFPPKEDAERIAGYLRREALYDGQSGKYRFGDWLRDAFANKRERRKISLCLGYPQIITNVGADFLCGEAPTFALGKASSKANKILKQITEANNLAPTLYEAAKSASFRADAVFRVRWGARHFGGEPEVILEELPAYNYFADLDQDNRREVLAEHIAWKRVWEKKTYLRLETHVPGTIYQRAFRLGSEGEVGEEVSLESVYEPGRAPQPEQKTGVPFSLLVHIPNTRKGGEYWGCHDYGGGLEGLFEALNNRASRIDQYLDKHAAPKVIAPPGLLGPDGAVNAEDLEYIEANSEIFKDLPRLLTWDGQMASSFLQVDMLIDAIFKLSEIAPAVFGQDKAGSIESGRAMRMRYVRTIAKINRKKSYFNPGVKRLLNLAALVYQANVDKSPAMDGDLEITWQDGMPTDYMEAVEAEAKRIQSGTSSRITSIRQIDGVDDAAAAEEVARVDADRASAAPKIVAAPVAAQETNPIGQPAEKVTSGNAN